VTYLPTVNLSPLLTFTQYSSTVSALQTALIAAYPALNIQVVADTLSGETTNAVVISNNSTVFTVPTGSYVGYNNGQWAQYTAAKLASTFTVYP